MLNQVKDLINKRNSELGLELQRTKQVFGLRPQEIATLAELAARQEETYYILRMINQLEFVTKTNAHRAAKLEREKRQ